MRMNNIKTCHGTCLTSLGICGVPFVSDNGANVKKALEKHERVYCADHGMNRALQTASAVRVTDIALYNETASKIGSVKCIVVRLRTLPQAAHLELKDPTPPLVARRPVSHIAMLSSVEKKSTR